MEKVRITPSRLQSRVVKGIMLRGGKPGVRGPTVAFDFTRATIKVCSRKVYKLKTVELRQKTDQSP